MVVIRLARFGSKKKPHYRITVADSRRHATKKFLEIIGSYNPSLKEKDKQIVLKLERANYWISKGAQATDRVKHIMKKATSAPA